MVEYDKSEEGDVELRDIRLRGHSYRLHSPDEFHQLMDEADGPEEMGEIRTEFKTIEDGRFNDMLGECHDFFWRLDQDEKEEFASKNTGMVRWVNVWGRLHTKAQFDVGGIESR